MYIIFQFNIFKFKATQIHNGIPYDVIYTSLLKILGSTQSKGDPTSSIGDIGTS